jgi:hypothetical protein
LAREELFGYLELLRNSPPATLSKTQQLIGLVKIMLDDANNLDIMDYDFTLGLGDLETYLKRKKSFLSPKKKNKEKIEVEDWKLILHMKMNHFIFHTSTSGVFLVPTMHPLLS